MNRIYKTIWNAATQSWTVAGELASAKGKSASKTVSTLATLSVVSVLGVSSAMAAVSINASGTDLAIKKEELATDTLPIAKIKDSDRNIVVINNGQTVNIESDGESAKNVIVIGSQNKHIYDEQILIGYKINSPFYPEHGISAGKAGDVAIGNRITLGGSYSSGKDAKDAFSTAVGYAAQAVGPVVAMGVGARSDMLDTQGWNSVKSGIVAVGPFALAADNKNGTTAVGALAASNYNYSVSLGLLSGAANDWENRGLGEQFNPIPAGSENDAKRKERDEYATFKINEAQGGSERMTSIGYMAGARGTNAIAVGAKATTGITHTSKGQNALAVGAWARAFTDNSIAIGDLAIAGGTTQAERDALDDEITRLTALRDKADKQVREANDLLKDDASAENKFKVASAQAALERVKLALERATVERDNYEDKNKNKGYNLPVDKEVKFALAIGSEAKARNSYATAIGRKAKAEGEASNAIGYDVITEVAAENANAIGYFNVVKAAGSSSIGHHNTIESKNVMALGNNINVNDKDGKKRDGAVVLGDHSDGEKITVRAVNKAEVNGVTYDDFAGTLGAAKGVLDDAADQGRFVSIGSKDNERQIKHVAAGEISDKSTDAINGSQLYMVANKVGENKKAIDDIKGNITNINQTIADNHWKIADDKGNKSDVKNGDKVTFKGENGVTVSLDKDSNTVTVRGGLTDADKQNIANDISNNIENVLNNNDVGFAIKQNGKNTLDANGNPLTKTEKVTPKDTVNFKNGNGTTVKAVTKKGATPTASDETSISVDVDGIKFTDKNGNNVVRDDNGDYVKVDANGNPTGEKVDNKDVIMNINNPAGGNTVINNLQVNGGKVEAGSKDAVNGDQLHKVAQQLNQNNHALNNKIDGVDKRASRGIATAGAMGMLPQPHISGRSMMAAATTSYRGQQSLAVGYSRLSDNGKHIIKFSGASNLAGKKDAMVGAAYGYQW